MQHPLFSWANQSRAVAAALALCCAIFPTTTAAAVASPPEMSAPVHAPAVAEHACPTNWGVDGVHNTEPLMLALAASPRPRDWTAFLAPAPVAVHMAALLAGDNPRPNYFAAPARAPTRGPVVAQSAAAPADAAAAGDNRPATLGDLKDTYNKLSGENRENRAELNATRAELRAENQELRRVIDAQGREHRRELQQAVDRINQRFDRQNQHIDQRFDHIQNTQHLIWATMVAGFVALLSAFLLLQREKKSAPTPAPTPAPANASAPAPANARAVQSPQPAQKPAARFDPRLAAAAVVLFAFAAIFPLAVAIAQ